MKKLLALVLALVMTLGLATVGANAAFTDAADISDDFAEAVEVMSALKVLDGADGAYNPKKVLTREEGAKIIAYMILGSNANTLSTTTTAFADVAGDRWSAGSIAFCTSENIIGGVGKNADGQDIFNPTGELDGYAFAKMLLVALGYNPAANAEGLVGSTYAINTAKLALTAGLLSNLDDITMSEGLTREKAAQMALNTEEATMVEYNNSISVVGSDLNVSISGKATPVARTTGTNYNQLAAGGNTEGTNANQTGNGTLQFAERYATRLLKVASAGDDFGRPGDHRWTLAGDEVIDVMDEPAVTLTANTTAANVVKALNGYTMPDNGGTTAYFPVSTSVETAVRYTGPAGLVTTNAYNDAAPAASTISCIATQSNAAAIAALTGDGTLVEFYADSNKHITKVVVVGYGVTTVSNVVAGSDRTTYSLAAGGSYIDYDESTAIDDTVSFTTAPAKGDTVTYVVRNGIAYLYPTTKVEGTQSTFSTSSGTRVSFVVDGTSYPIGNGVNGVTDTDYSNGSGVSYIDQYGFAVKRTSTAASTDYAYLVAATGSITQGLDGATASATVRAVLADGTVGTYTLALAKVKAGDGVAGTTPLNNSTAITNNNAVTFAAGDWYVKGTARPATTGTAATGPIMVYDTDYSTYAIPTNIGAAILSADEDVYGYTLSDSTITLEKVSELETNTNAGVVDSTRVTTTGTTVLTKNVTSYSAETDKTILADADTVFVIYNNVSETATVYTGPASLPSALAGAGVNGETVVKMSTTTRGTAKVIFATAAVVADATPSYVYIDHTKFTSGTYNGTSNVRSYTGYKADGTTVTLADPQAVVGAVTGLYSYNASDEVSANLATTASTIAGTTSFYAYDNILTETGSMIGVTRGVNEDYWNRVDDTQVVYLNGTSSINGNAGYVVLKASNGIHTSDIAAIFITSGTALLSTTSTAAQINAALATANNVEIAQSNLGALTGGIDVPAGKTLTVTGGNLAMGTEDLNVDGTLYVTGGNLTGSEDITGNGTINVSGNFVIDGTGTGDVITAKTINVEGDVTIGSTAAVQIGNYTGGLNTTINVTGTGKTVSLGSVGADDLQRGSTINVTGSGSKITLGTNLTGVNGNLNVTNSASAADSISVGAAITQGANSTIKTNGGITFTAALTANGVVEAASLVHTTTANAYTSTSIANASTGTIRLTSQIDFTALSGNVSLGGGTTATTWEFEQGLKAGGTNNRSLTVTDKVTVNITGGTLDLSADDMLLSGGTGSKLNISSGVVISGTGAGNSGIPAATGATGLTVTANLTDATGGNWN